MENTSLSGIKSEELNEKFYYDYFKKEKGNPHTEIGIELMIGPLLIEDISEHERASRIAHNFKIQLKNYDLNAGKQSEPQNLIQVFAKRLKNEGDKDSIEHNKKIVAILRKAYKAFESE